MSDPRQERSNSTQTQYSQREEGSEFARLMSQKVRQIGAALETREDSIEEILPDFMKGQGKRLIRRATQYWARADKALQNCSEASFVKCVIQAAELGFAIDGKMVHAVPYKGEAVLIPDYKGLIAVAKRAGLIQDCWSRVVYSEDEFEYAETDGVQHYRFVPSVDRSRDDFASAKLYFAVATHKDGWHRVEIMPKMDIDRIKGKARATSDKSPWQTDPGEMAKKTAIKRLLKTFSDDPGLILIMQLDDAAIGYADEREARREDKRSLTERVKARVAADSKPGDAEADDAAKELDAKTPPTGKPTATKADMDSAIKELYDCLPKKRPAKLQEIARRFALTDEQDAELSAAIEQAGNQ